MRPLSLIYKISIVLLLSFGIKSAYSQVKLDSGLVAFFKLDSNYADSSSTALNGTATSVTHSQGIHSLNNTGSLFNGYSSRINANIGNRGVTNTISISVWVKTTINSVNNKCLVSKYDWSVNKGYHLNYKYGYPNIEGRNSSSVYTQTTNTSKFISDGTWHHVLGVIAGNSWEIWVDGVLASSKTSTTNFPSLINNYPTSIGCYYSGGTNSQFFDGTMDELRIYSRELRATEIAYLSNQLNNNTISNATACDSYTSPSGNATWNSSGTYSEIKYGSEVADSVSTINLLIPNIDTTVAQIGSSLHAVINNNYSYQWIDCSSGNAPIAGAQSSIFSPTISGDYAVAINYAGCLDTSNCVSLNVINNSLPYGNSVFLDGTNDFIEIPNHSNLHSTTNLTLEAWIKPCKTTGTNVIYSKIWCSGNQNSYFFSVQDGKLKWVWYSAGCGSSNGLNRYKSTNVVVQTNVWQHVAVVHSPTSVKLFVDGVEVVATLEVGNYGNLRPSTQPLRAGTYRSLSGSYGLHFSGQMDELRVWNQSISSALIGSRYNAPLIGSESGLMGYYNLDNYTVGPNQTVPNNATALGSVGDATTRGSSSYISPFYLDSNTSYIFGPDTFVNSGTTLSLNAAILNGSYLWQDGTTSPIFLASDTGQFIISYGNSCLLTTDTLNVGLAPPDLDSGLVAYFKLDANTADSSVTAIHGTGYNLTNDEGIKCIPNTAYDFNGTSSKIVCGTDNRSITNTVNISAWVKTTVNTGHRFIVDKYQWQNADKGYLLAIKNGIPYVGARNTSGFGAHTWLATQTFLISDGNWHHLLGVVSSNSLEIWVDGVLKATSSLTATNPDLTTSYDLNIGYYYKGSLTGTANHFDGIIDEVRLYNRNLSRIEIDSLQSFRNIYENQSFIVCDSLISPSGNSVWNTTGIYQDTVTNSCGADSIYTIDLTILNSSFTSITETTCGTYTSPSGKYTWTTTGVYHDTLSNTNGCDSILGITLNINPISVTNLVVSNCYSYTSPSGSFTWYSTGVYTDTLQSVLGCDSVLSISVAILPYEIVAINETVCDSYTSPSGNNTWTASGSYIDLISHANDCDTLYNISLTVLKSTTANFSGTVCGSFSSPSGKYIWVTSGTYLDTIPNNVGCDSIITFNLIIGNTYQVYLSDSSCNSYTWPVKNQTYTASGSYTHVGQTVLGCDSVVTLNLTINNDVIATQSELACDGYTWILSGLTYNSSGKDTMVYTTINGCDSSVVLDLTIKSSSSSIFNLTVCDSLISPSGNVTWNTSGTYLDTIPNSVGCDSVLTYNLVINNSNPVNQVVSACNSYVWASNGITYWSSGIYGDTLSNSLGCDSIIILDLSINAGDTTGLSITSCNTYQWPVTGLVYSQSGVYSKLYSNQNGCDSLVQLNLAINLSTSRTVSVVACDSLVSPSGNSIWNSSGTYLDTIPNTAGCDSVLTINLIINQSIQSSVNATSCDSYTWAVNGQTYFNSGVFSYSGQTISGCDSIVTLNLTINTSDRNVNSVSSCSNYFWSVNSVTYSSSSMDSMVYANVSGCDSVVVLDLTINSKDTTQLNIQSCGSYFWNATGIHYTVGGIYTNIMTNVNGCDSLLVLDLVINQPSDSTLFVSSCGDYLWPQTGVSYANSGMYSDTLSNSKGCDSVLVLDLTILDSSSETLTEYSCGLYTAPDGVLYTLSGQYQAVIANQVGCDSVITINLHVTHTDTSIVNLGGELHAVSNSGYSYQWIDCNNGNAPIPGAQDSVFAPIVNGKYAVEITNGSCLVASSCMDVTNVGIASIALSDISVYPNPVESMLTIKNNERHILIVVITDVSGKIIARVDANSELTQIDVSDFAPGVYFVRLESHELYRVEKIVVR